MSNVRDAIEAAFEDNAVGMRSAIYDAIQDKVSAALADKKIEVAQSIMATEAKVEPDAPDADRVANRKRLQAIKDKQEDERAEKGTEEKKPSNVRNIKGTYGTSHKEDDLDEGIVDAMGNVVKTVGQTAGKVLGGVAKTVGAIRQTPAAVGDAYNKGRAGAEKAIA